MIIAHIVFRRYGKDDWTYLKISIEGKSSLRGHELAEIGKMVATLSPAFEPWELHDVRFTNE